MRITGLSLRNFENCAATVSEARYSGNVIMHADGHNRTSNRDGTRQCTARLAVLNSRGPGSRTAASGRHGPYACWHAYRDVLTRVFTRHPGAVITTMLATYRGMEGFQGLYPATAREEACSPELCQCGETTLPLTRAELATTARTLSVITRLEPLAYTVLAAHRQALGLAANSYREGDDQGDADYVSAAVREASAQYAQSAELLGEGDKPADPLVFGSEPNHYSPPRHYQED